MKCNETLGYSGVEKLEGRRLLSAGPTSHGDADDGFVTQTNLVSDQAGMAAHRDPNLVNAWGVSFGPTTPFWISDNNAGVATLYDGNGVAQPAPSAANPTAMPLVVTIPGGGSTATNPVMSNPTGQVFAGGLGFSFTANGKTVKPIFIFVGEDGAITGWDPAIDRTHAQIAVDNSSVPDAANGAVYKGATLGDVGGGKTDLFVTNVRAGTVEVYNQSFQQVHLSTSAFQDRHIPAGFAPFNVQNIGGKLYVTYAKQNAEKHDDVAGAGNGFVDIYNTDGTLAGRLQHGNFLDSPWGVTQAPSSWGRLAGDILVGQFGSGRIDIFDARGHFRGFLRGADQKPLVIDGLWDVTPGNGANSSDTQKIYFTAGPDGETHGLFGSLTFSPNNNDNDHKRDHDDHGGDNDGHGHDH